MKKIVKILGLVLLLGLILTGCGQKSATDNKGNLVIKNHSFSGKFTNPGDSKAHKMSVYFTDDNQAVLTMDGYSEKEHLWIREIMAGQYTINKANRILIRVKRATNEGFKTQTDMNKHETPTKMVKENVSDHDIELKIEKKHLALSKINKLSPIKNAEVADYDTFVNNDQKNYDHKYAKLSKRSFMSPATDLMGNGIAFKGSNFIWKYGGPSDYVKGLDQGGSIGIFTGSYKLEAHKLTLFVYEKTNLYEGTILSLGKNYYQNSVVSYSLPNEFVFEFTKNNKLSLLTSSQYLTVTDMLDYGTVTGAPNYDRWIKKYNVQTIDSKMHQKDLAADTQTNSDSKAENDYSHGIPVEDPDDKDSDSTNISSANDFENFLSDQGLIDPDSDNEYQAKDGNGYSFPIVDSDETVTAKYQVFWDDDDGAITHIIMLGNDGNIYAGNSGQNMFLDSNTTDAYNNLN